MSILDVENDLTEEQKANIIECIGVDDKRHVCVAWEDTTLCGVNIKKKGDDKLHRYSCFYCTY